MRHEILCTTGPLAKGTLRILGGIGNVTVIPPSRDTLLARIPDATILIVGIGLTIDRTVISAGKHLKMIATVSTGTDHIDIQYAESRGITVLSLKGEREFLNSVTATAELALGLLLALVRNIPAAYDSVKNGAWERSAFEGATLSGKTLGIVGMGRLGNMMARYGRALGMEVLGITKRSGDVSFGELLKRSDVISIHIPLNEETEGMFDADAFKKMKSTAVLINTARGKVVNENDLMRALKSREIAGYAADVLGDELSFAGACEKNPLARYARTHRNVLLTPHIGGLTAEARAATGVFMAKKIRATLQAAD